MLALTLMDACLAISFARATMKPAAQTFPDPENRSASMYGDPTYQTYSERSGSLALAAGLIGFALFSSGAAGLVNQVVWQRSLKVFLGGSETICASLVVLVFMAGLGIGSVWMGRRAAGFRNPLKAFGLVEILLSIVNLGVCALLASSATASVFTLQQIAVSLGVPLLMLYAVLAITVLAVPCLLMGATMPLAAETCQRNLGLSNARLLGLLFFVNTVGSVVGTVVSSGYMISHLGLSISLLIAAGLNLVAGLLLLVLTLVIREVAVPQTTPDAAVKKRLWRQPGIAEVLAFGLGFCSLGYEMYLFRLIPLRHEPLPFTFAAVLAGFLTFWSLGAAFSSRKGGPSVATALRICALMCCATISMFVIDTKMAIDGTWSLVRFVLMKSPYFLPCILFGYLFGRVAADAAKSWGADIGRIYAWNTAGACTGILLVTFVGYEIPFFGMVLAIALVLFAMQEYAAANMNAKGDVELKNAHYRWLLPTGLCGGLVATCLVFDVTKSIPGQRMFSGRDGVIILTDSGNMIWDGLWHSRLSKDNDHVGTNNWSTAVFPVICHPTGKIEDVCVIGTGTGITPGTLAKLSTVRCIDSYDICHELENLYREYPDGTLNVANNPKINLLWCDARTGMTLNPRQYDIIQTQPLYLKQAGSSLLNSIEFYQLISDRLKPDGVFSLYSNGSPEQAFVIRETADQVFRYRQSFMNGYLLVMSNEPIVIDEARLSERYALQDPLWEEIRNFAPASTAAKTLMALDKPMPSGNLGLLIRDDRPIVEYPGYLRHQIDQHDLPFKLPYPVSNWAIDQREGTAVGFGDG